MTVRRTLLAVSALALLLAGAGCGGDERLNTAVETDDPLYQQAKKLQRLERNPEALVAFLKVIEKRGDQYSPESHFEAGQIYLRNVNDPVEAIHHFRRYLFLMPKSKEAPYVSGLVEEARRQYARTIPGRPLEDQSQVMSLREQVDALQKENERLRAALGTGSAVSPPPLLPPPRPTTEAAAPRMVPPVASPAAVVVAPVTAAPVAAAPPPANASAGLNLLKRPATPSAPATRRHTVVKGDTLYSLSKKYGVKLEDLQAANRDILPNVNAPVPLGAELKIP